MVGNSANRPLGPVQIHPPLPSACRVLEKKGKTVGCQKSLTTCPASTRQRLKKSLGYPDGARTAVIFASPNSNYRPCWHLSLEAQDRLLNSFSSQDISNYLQGYSDFVLHPKAPHSLFQLTGHVPMSTAPRKEDTRRTPASLPSRAKKSSQVSTKLSNDSTLGMAISWKWRRQRRDQESRACLKKT